MSGRRGQSAQLQEGDDEGTEISPGQMYLPFVKMEELLDKLKLLDYDKEFVLGLRMKPFNK